MTFQATSLSLSDLDARARDVFKTIVETYLETGAPVGLADIVAAKRCFGGDYS